MRDGETIDTLMSAFYAAISGDSAPEQLVDLFYPRTTLVETRVEDAMPCSWVLNPRDLAEVAGEPARDVEIRREVKRFGQIAQVFSVYETRDGDQPVVRGLILLHLWHDGGRWWMMNAIREEERDGLMLPDRWLAEPDS